MFDLDPVADTSQTGGLHVAALVTYHQTATTRNTKLFQGTNQHSGARLPAEAGAFPLPLSSRVMGARKYAAKVHPVLCVCSQHGSGELQVICR